MSEAARVRRSKRQFWALPHSRHDKLVSFLNIALPVSVGVLAAFLFMAPVSKSNELSFLVSRDNVEIAEERLRIESARYSGVDAQGRPFELSAKSALQRSSNVPVVEMDDLSAQMETNDGVAFIAANRGLYNIDEQRVDINGALELRASDGYGLSTSDVELDLSDRRIRATGDVSGRFPDGTFRADAMLVDIATRTVLLANDVSGTLNVGTYRANRMRVNFNNRTAELSGGVQGQLPIGTYRADRMRVNMPDRNVVLDGGVRLRINQQGGR